MYTLQQTFHHKFLIQFMCMCLQKILQRLKIDALLNFTINFKLSFLEHFYILLKDNIINVYICTNKHMHDKYKKSAQFLLKY